MENNSFVAFDSKQKGLLFDDSKNDYYPIKYYNVVNGQGVTCRIGCSYYGYVYSGEVFLKTRYGLSQICEGKYFSISEACVIDGFGSAIVIEVMHENGTYPNTQFRAVSLIGGPVEAEGRLKYIDGCTDSLLIPPVKMGDPCLNHLHFPKDIDQTPHTHPSHRIGIVAKGQGECVTPFGNLPLTEGMIFVIKAGIEGLNSTGLDGKEYPIGTHKFRTYDQSMDVVAFHPDSDFGATDINHPMINRTMVDGVSAAKIDAIRTK